MLALVDADYRFLWVEVGGQGHMSDAQIFLASSLRADLEDGNIKRPPPSPLTDHPDDTTLVPYFIVSDDAFALRDYCIKPYSRKTMEVRELIFNYRLSRARRVVENAFGLLAQRFRIFQRSCELQPSQVRLQIKCCLVLHNLLMHQAPLPADAVDREQADGQVIPGLWRQEVMWEDQPQPQAGRHNTPGKRVREILADYFGTPAGLVPWQWDTAHVQRPQPVGPAAPASADPASPASADPASPASADPAAPDGAPLSSP